MILVPGRFLDFTRVGVAAESMGRPTDEDAGELALDLMLVATVLEIWLFPSHDGNKRQRDCCEDCCKSIDMVKMKNKEGRTREFWRMHFDGMFSGSSRMLDGEVWGQR